ncbi:MAG: DUF423 domain-containing protein [Rhodanobacteraceae bacterium]|nr:DUF423 domain-containing protein [Xanthomonadales bacterium]MCP5478758.1 DUF423 domain-containing protein [Rhodanobacteraceae bacterium]HPF74248.1 DUF423 domain-containing protein [Xanthomonadaceae bacterium]HRY01117.1 DUF423 domain-containing protein [Xanthomonadaceae bacterium]
MTRSDRLIAAAGALALGIGTAAAAASAHFQDALDATRLGSASQMLLVHGLGLFGLALARHAWPSKRRTLGWIAALLAAGLLLFAGSLLFAVAFDASTALAPFGGGLTILCWVAAAIVFLLPVRSAK